VDVLKEMLASLRLSGAVFVDGAFGAPFTVLSHMGPQDCGRFFAIPRQMIAYHYVREGSMWCRIDDQPPVEVHAGEIVLLPRNPPHFVYGPQIETPRHCSEAEIEAEGPMLRIRAGGEGPVTRTWCGYLGTDADDNLLLDSLPGMLIIAADAAQADWVAKSIEFAAEGLAARSPELVGKLAEALFAEAVRRYVASLPEDERGWLAGLRDPAVGKALALIHGRYGEAWTLDELARAAGVSKTVLAERFRALIDEAPMQYCARWRMKIAADMLRDRRENACSVAYSVGFNSEAAFNRAFKRQYGMPPATWRRAEAMAH
jgi:AraC-like DNA-binding protein